jgi:hypothetical protein
MITCEEVELELPEPSVEARAHLETCAACRETAKLLGLATLPPLSEAERAMLGGLAASLQREVQAPRRRDSVAGRVASLALAAGLGALVASAAMLKLSPEPRVETRTVLVTPPEIPVLEVSDEFDLSDDEVFFEVGWPSPTEGDL